MEDSRKYLNTELEKLVETIPYIHCVYGYCEHDKNHIIKIEPKIIWDNEYFNKLIKHIVLNFIDIFPNSNIYIIPEEDEWEYGIRIKGEIYEY